MVEVLLGLIAGLLGGDMHPCVWNPLQRIPSKDRNFVAHSDHCSSSRHKCRPKPKVPIDYCSPGAIS